MAIQQTLTPLAQTFIVSGDKSSQFGTFITKIGLFFGEKDSKWPVSIELRTTASGYPSNRRILPGSKVTLNPSQVSVSADATAETIFTFDEPIYLLPGSIYALTVKTNAVNTYKLWAGYIGDFYLGTSDQKITKNLGPGDLFKSSGSITPVPEVNADLKYNLYRAEFTTGTATVKFVDENVDRDFLGTDPFLATSGSKVIKVLSPNHGFQVNDRVFISGLTNGTTYNGILGSNLNGRRTITGVDGFYYQFTAGGSANATDSIYFGGSGIRTTRQHIFDLIKLDVDYIDPKNQSNIQFEGDFTTSKSLAGTETPYGTTTTGLANKNTIAFDAPHVVMNDSNEDLHSITQSTIISASINVKQDAIGWVSPMFDLQRNQMIVTGNVIDHQDSAASTNYNVPLVFVDETHPNAGTSLAKHITKPVILENSATGLKIYMGASRPNGTYLDMYYRTSEVGNDSDMSTFEWTAISPDTTVQPSIHPLDFREYEYTIGGTWGNEVPEFNKYQIKIVMGSINSAEVPRIRDLRTIALGTEGP